MKALSVYKVGISLRNASILVRTGQALFDERQVTEEHIVKAARSSPVFI